MTDTARPNLTGKIALITGASQGIGAAVAEAYAAAGAHVILAARNKAKLEEVDDRIQAAGGQATLVEIDITKGESIDQLGAALFERFGKLDILVGNAAVLGTLTPITHLKPKEWDKVIATNLTANFRLLRSFDPLLKAAEKAHALFVTSSVTARPFAYWGAYNISKLGLERLVETYNAENSMTKIRAHLVDPGEVRSAMRAAAYPGEDPERLPAPNDPIVLEHFFKPLRDFN